MGVDRKMDEKTGTLRKQRGRASVVFENPPLIMAAASTVGKKEGDGPLGVFFDRVELDPMLGKKSWEEAESELQSRTAGLVIREERAFEGRNQVFVCGGSSGTAHRHFFWKYKSGDPNVRALRSMLHHGGRSGAGRHVRGGWICGSCSCRRFQPFRFGGEAVPFSVGIWESEAVFGYMDGDWVRSGDRVLRGLPGEGSAACEDHGGDDGKNRGYGFS